MTLFSIITITYNAGNTVLRTLESVAEQTFSDYEHIIVDGASADDTLKIIAAAPGGERRRVKSERDKGIYDAMNKGIGLSHGKYLIFLNAGDKFHSPEILAKIANAIKENQPGIVYGQTNLVDNDGSYLGPRHLTAPADLKYKDFAKGMLVCHQAFIVLKRIAPLYNVNYRFSADYEWCIRCLQHSRKNVILDEPLVDYLSEGVTTANRRKSLIERFKIMSYYYGFWPTLWRHFGFIGRFVRFQKQMNRK